MKMLLALLLSALIHLTASKTHDQIHEKDGATPDAVVTALYESISADPGQTRNWDRFRSLFFENARFVMAMQSDAFQGIIASDVETMIQQTEIHYKTIGFHEIELDRKTVQYSDFASVYSSFEVKHTVSDKTPIMRGLNHFQLLHDGQRWYVISNTTVIENEAFIIPDSL